MKSPLFMFFSLLVLLEGASVAQLLDPHKLLDPEPTDTWPTYNGDYSGRRFSPLGQIQTSNVSGLALAWMYQARVAPLHCLIARLQRTCKMTRLLSSTRIVAPNAALRKGLPHGKAVQARNFETLKL